MNQTVSNIKATVMLITPELAAMWLKNNPKNRSKSRSAIVKLAEAILNGEWKCNGETVVFDSKGRLIDGQHRLEAIIMADEAVYCVIVQGVSPDAFDTIDQGRKRSNGDVLSILGEADSKMLAAACNWVWRYREGTMFQKQQLRPQQVQLVLQDHPGLRNSIRMGRHLAKSRLCPPAVATALHYLFVQIDEDWGSEFMQRLADGANLDNNSPILELRHQLNMNQSAVSKLPPVYVAGMIIKAWNRWITGKSSKGLPMQQGETFPKVAGAAQFPPLKIAGKECDYARI